MNKFYNSLVEHIQANEPDYANQVIMKELGRILAEDRENFVLLLRNADVPATMASSDAELVEMFLNNLPNNRKLLIGASLLVNHHNKTVGFDGEAEISDIGVKAIHKSMLNYFSGPPMFWEEQSGADGEAKGGLFGGGGWGNAIKSIVDTGGGIAGKVMDQQRSKKSGATDLLYKQKQAKIDMASAAMEQRKLQQQALIQKQKDAAKTRRMWIIGGSIAGGLLLLGLGIYAYNRSKK